MIWKCGGISSGVSAPCVCHYDGYGGDDERAFDVVVVGVVVCDVVFVVVGVGVEDQPSELCSLSLVLIMNTLWVVVVAHLATRHDLLIFEGRE